MNLQSNALKFTEQGSVTIKATTVFENEETYLNISVTDTGIGIKKEDQDQLFKMFGYIKDSNQMNVHGIGLGLNLSKKIIEQFGGKIGVKSEPEQGSTFEFTIKLYNNIEERNSQVDDENLFYQ